MKQTTSARDQAVLTPDDVFASSSFCSGGSCLMVARQANGNILVRDSKDASKQTLQFDSSEWAAFLKGVKNNEFELE